MVGGKPTADTAEGECHANEMIDNTKRALIDTVVDIDHARGGLHRPWCLRQISGMEVVCVTQ